ncbi:MAG: DUF1801 domain-containing protein [Bacteroidota bacterium]|nr:DUF1801 domain-containing protein [Bacteroidota bacterium]MDE2955676.1 DUF1801 domain-containing protein [Bacteroidota bacterium]
MAELKTRPTDASVEEFLAAVGDEQKRQDSAVLLDLMSAATGESPRMWGPSIIGFGTLNYRYDSGRTGTWFVVGFSPRKRAFSLYLAGGLGPHAERLKRLGKHTRGKSCLYIRRLSEVDLQVLTEMINATAAQQSKSGCQG